MSIESIPFLVQAKFLDQYSQSPDPNADPDAVDVILNTLQTNPELRAYFFYSRPHASWATVLWEHGYFKDPPSLEITAQGAFLKQWDVQNFLINVAPEVPDIVVQHVKSISAHGWYISQALRALIKLPVARIEENVPRVIELLGKREIAMAIGDVCDELFEILVNNGRLDAGLTTFRALTAPVLASGDDLSGTGAYKGYAQVMASKKTLGSKQQPSVGFGKLIRTAPETVADILEIHLVDYLRTEARAQYRPEDEFSAGWRNAIEDTDQDILDTYKDYVLSALRDAVDSAIGQDAIKAKERLARYFDESHIILRRLALYMIQRHAKLYPDFVRECLLRQANYDDVDIHHEFFLLLLNGFVGLSIDERKSVVAIILAGPDESKTQELAEWVIRYTKESKDLYIDKHKKAWQRDRLWMIQDYLDDDVKRLLSRLVAEGGTPPHPTFLSWSSGVHSIQNISPLTQEELARLSPDEFGNVVKQWQPNPKQEFSFERISVLGLAGEAAKTIASQPERYKEQLYSVCSNRPEVAVALLDLWASKETTNVPWPDVISLCQMLVDSDVIWQDSPDTAVDFRWVDVRRSITRLILVGLSNPTKTMPTELFSGIESILVKLADDPDPSLEQDRPPENYAGHMDAFTIAINHVRPMALDALILYLRERARRALGANANGTAPPKPSANILAVFDKHLDKSADPSRAVHSVFGHRLGILYRLDKEWVESNAPRIFPMEGDEETIWFYVAASDALVLSPYYTDLGLFLKPFYQRAIQNVAKGFVSKTHLHPAARLAEHIAFEYLFSDYDILSDVGQKCLLAEFFILTPPEVRKEAAGALQRIYSNRSGDKDKYWPRVRRVWEWRTRLAISANHSPEFNEEMEHFAQLLVDVPESENISALRPLLEGLLPHLSRLEYRNFGWDSLEKFLAKQVERDPVGSIKFYRLMYAQKTSRPQWLHHDEAATKIIEVAAAAAEARPDALALIDKFATWRDFTYRYIYDRYAR